MNKETENFETLCRALTLKRHEVPPPGYFNQFSANVIRQIEAGERRSKSNGLFAWLHDLWQALERKPALAGGFGVAVCGMLVAGIMYSANVDPAGVGGFASGQSLATFEGGNGLGLHQSGVQSGLGATADSTSPIMISSENSGSLFDEFSKVQVQPASFSFGN